MLFYGKQMVLFISRIVLHHAHASKMLFDRQLQILVAEKQFVHYNIYEINFDRIKPRGHSTSSPGPVQNI
jgi:hypothetical protein